MIKLKCWLRSVLLIVMGLFWIPVVWADLNDGLVAYYPFNGNANDESGNGNHGVEQTPLSYVDGKIDLATKFNGSESIQAIAPINQNSSFSVSAWVKPYTVSESGAHTIVFERDKHGNDSCGRYSAGNYGVQIYGGKFAFEISTYMPDGSCYHPIIFAVEEIIADKYYLITAIYNKKSAEIKLYVNGILRAKENVGNKLRVHPNAILNISKNSSSAFQGWNGELDDIRIYNRTLSNSEIEQLYQPTSTPSNNCWATYENGKLHIPCFKLKGELGEELHYELYMQYKPLSKPISFQLTGAKHK